MGKKVAWLVSLAVSILLMVILLNIWDAKSEYKKEKKDGDSKELLDTGIGKRYLDSIFNKDELGKDRIEIKTGIFIQSLKFYNSDEVSLTGYIWQHYTEGQRDSVRLDSSEVGFIFPEQVNTAGDIQPRKVYQVYYKDTLSNTITEELIGWYFEVTLRQPFDYKKYPFDHKTVWVRMWPKNFIENVVLVPDLEAYESTEGDSIYGRAQKIVLGSWKLEDTYFNYKVSTYDTNFGFTETNDSILALLSPDTLSASNKNAIAARKDITAWNKNFPELHYNFVIKRKNENAYIIYLLPLFLIASLLFGAMLTISNRMKKGNNLGFSAFGFIGASSGLFFVLMLAHIQLRQQFEGTGIVFIEYFYILMYAILVLVTTNSYLFSIRASFLKNIILYKDNLIPKVFYWPLLIGSMIVITLAVFW